MNPERVNIKDLTIEEPERAQELFFDVERDIPKEDWERWENLLNIDREQNNWYPFISLASGMRLLNPNIDLKLSKEDWETMIKKEGESEVDPRMTPPDDVFSVAASIKTIDPKVAIEIRKDVWDRYKKKLNENKINDWKFDNEKARAVKLAVSMKILDPAINFGFGESDWQVIKDDLSKARHPRYQSMWEPFAKTAMQMKILNPGFDVELGEDDWAGMKEALEGFKKGKWNSLDYIQHVVAMKILAAKKVDITNNGIEIDTSGESSLSVESSELPEQRKF